MIINILLPYKEKFNLLEASSVSNTVKNNVLYSQFKKKIVIYGVNVKKPILKENFFGIKKSWNPFKSKNKNLAEKMCQSILKKKNKNQLIELHNRPYLFNYVKKNLKNYPISIFFHNNPLDMKGSKSIKDRQYIIQNAAGIFCVSEFIKSKFLEGIDNKTNNVHVLYNGVKRYVKTFPTKKKEVLFVGKLVPEKGVDIFVDAATKLTKKFADWSFCIIGSGKDKDYFNNETYSSYFLKKFRMLGNKANVLGFLSHAQVQRKMQSASIIVVPSVWDEPFGLVVSEAMSSGTAIIASNVGGIPEILGKNGILLNNISAKKVENSLFMLMTNKKKLDQFQMLSWKNFRLTSEESSKKLDFFRLKIKDNFLM
jgi:glycosyltransferase involved in cell wall biosynthesis